MAIDTAAKRRAVAALSLAPFFGPGVTPDATPDQFWRQAAGYGYPGILAGAAIVVEAARQIVHAVVRSVVRNVVRQHDEFWYDTTLRD